MARTLINRQAARRLVNALCAEWQIKRKNIPAAVFTELESHAESSLRHIALSRINHVPAPRQQPKRKPKAVTC